MRVSPHGNTKCPGEAKVRQLQVVALVNEKILRLEIAVENAMRVAVEKAGG
jgi:hypothetical protein